MSRLSPLLLPFWFASAVCWAVPFLVAPHTFPIPTFYSEFVAALCWVVLAVAVFGVAWRSKVGLPAIAIAPLALMVVLIVQLLIASPINVLYSFAACLCLIGAAAVTGLGVRSREVPGAVEAVVVGLLVGGIATVAIELLHLFRAPGLPELFVTAAPNGPDRRMWANLNQPNHVGSYLAMGLAGCAFLMQKHGRWKWLLAIVALALLLGMSLTFSRTVWIHLAVVGVLCGWLLKGGAHGSHGWLKAAMPVVLLLAGYQLCNGVVAFANEQWQLGLPTSLGGRMLHGVSDRAPIWNHAWHMFLSHPWLGAGWGDYAWNQYVQTDVLGKVVMGLNAHNVVLDLLAKVGITGFLAVALPFIGLIPVVWKRKLTAEAAFFYAVILILAAHSMLEYPLHYLFFLLPFAFALGYVDTRVLRFPSSDMTTVLISVVAICMVALLCKLWGEYRSVERLYYSKGNFQQTLVRESQRDQFLLSPFATLAVATQLNVTQETAPVIAILERRAVQLYPGPSTVQRYALSLAYSGKPDEAVTQVRRLYNHYWIGYATWSALLTEECAKKPEALRDFCHRLKTEHLLSGAD